MGYSDHPLHDNIHLLAIVHPALQEEDPSAIIVQSPCGRESCLVILAQTAIKFGDGLKSVYFTRLGLCDRRSYYGPRLGWYIL